MDDAKPYLVPIGLDMEKMSVKDAQELYRFDWQDAHGRLWKVRADDSTSKYNPEDQKIAVHGQVYITEGMKDHLVGSFVRYVYPRERKILHEALFLEHDTVAGHPVQGQGFSSAWLKHLMPIYKDLGVDSVDTHTMDTGAYVWPKLGFDNTRDAHIEWDSDAGAYVKKNLIYMLTGLPDEDAFPDFDEKVKTPEFSKFREKVQEILNEEYAPSVGKLLDMLPSEFAEPYLYDEMIDMHAHPNDILGALHRKYEKPQVDGQTQLEI